MRFAFGAAALAITVGLAACTTGGQSGAGSSSGSFPAPATATASAPPLPTMEVSPMTATPSNAGSSPSASPVTGGPFLLTSSAFADGDAIPRDFSCDAANVSPPLAWTGVPAGTAALVLMVDDPDARSFVHWIVLDLAGHDGDLPKGVAPTAASPQQGRNDFGKVGWGGPCPPSGTHHYRFTLTALGAPLGLGDHPGGGDVRKALGRATVLGKVTLSGTYARS
jgi:Raf kinase inhibitor-like YbhB/YbcL family protein